MKSYSLTIAGAITFVIARVLGWADIEAVPDSINTFVLVSAQIIGAIMVYLGRLRQGDIYWWGGKIPVEAGEQPKEEKQPV